MSAEPVLHHDRPGSTRGPVGSGSGPGSGTSTSTGPRESKATVTPNPAVAAKSRRVRTGCLTCRERHLKCDEGTPDCNNCRKSSRECKRGLRLNFIDTQVKNPPMVPPTRDWSVQFHDESRMIASEYRGGLGRYPRCAEDITPPRELEVASVPPRRQRWNHQAQAQAHTQPQPQPQPASTASYQESHPQRRKESDNFLPSMVPAPISQAPPALSVTPNRGGMLLDQYVIREDAFRRPQGHRLSDFSSLPSPCFPSGSALTPGLVPDGLMTPPTERATGEREYLSTEDEIRFMQAFTDSVAIWMDVMDKEKQFSKVLPYLALQSPMLLNALLACGAKHLSLVEGHGEDKAHYYYDEATKSLLKCLKNPDRNTAECATTAVILNVYEIMNEKPNQRMSHIAGARALIRECKWDATSPGISGACVWVNIGMEVLSCLAFNWQTAWEPDLWGLDLEFTNWTPTPRTSGSVDGDREAPLRNIEGDEELWVHRILYILAKVTNFHASIPRFQEASPHDEQARRQNRFNEWKRLKGLCDAWNSNCPRSMQPYGYSHTPSSTSLFPRVWLVKRPSILARLFYHTAMCLLAQINPMEPRDSEDNRVSQLLHAHHTCGIIAHTNDPAIASGALRSLAVAGAVLTDRQEQMEVLAIMEKRSKETGWRLGRVVTELKVTWGWESGGSTSSSRTLPGGPGLSSFLSPHIRPEDGQSPLSRTASSTPSTMKPTVNPLLANADFAKKNHPYQNWYEPPNRTAGASPQAPWPV
ncbi:hypothetical protein B0T16DRAFT_335978 [Cercophora newfieldiana]|uniref:Zn(2)-C6 fungal-type domain-containing protein n=1 Tax=Cercophora newfieldiana TaxID=92897 RepID=A0AA39XWD3_9PEZI|nr:hypothetical protein B0T16DRAFT_335978 [Cercophora newfieldiana]